MKKVVLFLLVSALCVGTGAFGAGKSESAKGPIVMKLAHGSQLSHPLQTASEQMASKVKERTNGAIEIQVFGNRQLGEERDNVEGLQLGTVDLTVVSTGPLVGLVPEVGIVDLPFLFTSSEHAYKVLDGEIGKELLRKFEPKGIVGVGFMENGWRMLTTSAKKKVVTPADFRGLKIRTMENRIHMSGFRNMGASPVPMVWGEAMTAMRQGIIDGQENAIPTLFANKIWEVQKYVALTRHLYTPYFTLMSKKTYDGLNESQRKIVIQAAKEAGDWQRQEMTRQSVALIEELRKNGMEVYEVDMKLFEGLANQTYKEFESQYPKELIDRIKAVK